MTGCCSTFLFGALPDVSRSDGTYLIDHHEIVNVPSVSALQVLRHKRASLRKPSQLLALVADPVFDAHDPRLAGAGMPSARPVEPGLLRAVSAARLSIGNEIPRLPFARQEAESILRLIPRNQATTLLDFDANRDAVVNGQLRHYHIAHFITHAFVNTEDTDLSGLSFRSLIGADDHEGLPDR